MPQMMPLNWLILFINFMIMFWILFMLNYYNFLPKMNNITPIIKYQPKNFNWWW